MELAAAVGLVEEVHRVRGCASAGREELTAALVVVERGLAWFQAAQADLVARLAGCASFPEADLAVAARTSVRGAGRLLERAGVLEAAPVFAEALDEARVTAGHVDALGRTLRSLEPAHREGLLERVGVLAEVAETATVEDFARRLRLASREVVEVAEGGPPVRWAIA